MKIIKIFVTILVITTVIGLATDKVQAAFFDRDKLAQALAVRFKLNEKEVATFLAEFQYPTATTTPAPTPVPQTVVKENIKYEYDDGADKYVPATKLVNFQHNNHLDFIEGKLDLAVTKGRLSTAMENKILVKLAEMMGKSPSSTEFEKMELGEQRSEIASFKTEMERWLKGQDMTLGELRAMTGKGNKYLMGIYLE